MSSRSSTRCLPVATTVVAACIEETITKSTRTFCTLTLLDIDYGCLLRDIPLHRLFDDLEIFHERAQYLVMNGAVYVAFYYPGRNIAIRRTDMLTVGASASASASDSPVEVFRLPLFSEGRVDFRMLFWQGRVCIFMSNALPVFLVWTGSQLVRDAAAAAEMPFYDKLIFMDWQVDANTDVLYCLAIGREIKNEINEYDEDDEDCEKRTGRIYWFTNLASRPCTPDDKEVCIHLSEKETCSFVSPIQSGRLRLRRSDRGHESFFQFYCQKQVFRFETKRHQSRYLGASSKTWIHPSVFHLPRNDSSVKESIGFNRFGDLRYPAGIFPFF